MTFPYRDDDQMGYIMLAADMVVPDLYDVAFMAPNGRQMWSQCLSPSRVGEVVTTIIKNGAAMATSLYVREHKPGWRVVFSLEYAA